MKILLTLLLMTATNVWASDVSIKGADFDISKGNSAKLSIKHAGIINNNPQLTISDKTLSLTIPNSGLENKINKKLNGAHIFATMSGEEAVTVTMNLPYSLKGKESDVTITLKEGVIDVLFPRNATAKPVATNIQRSPSIAEKAAIVAVETQNAEAEKLDENYLSNLVKKQEKLAEEKHAKDPVDQKETDRVTLTQSSVTKNAKEGDSTASTQTKDGESRFSVMGYVGKFVAFLSIMIAGFYGVLTLFKKGIIKKGKLGFLHSTKLVEVLSTTHIAPKRQLLMVKAHKQVFLISSSETGIQFLSEINDVTGLIKTGEEEITGSNFDTNLTSAARTEKDFKLKEVETFSNYATDYPMDSLDDMLNDDIPAKAATNAAKAIEKNPVKDQVRFSDQIKTKVKNLKQL